jgi:TRAP transporter TAXI family solute receptor
MAPRTAPLRALARSRLGRATAALLLVVGALAGWWLSGGEAAGYPKGVNGFSTGVPDGVYDRYGHLLSGYLRTAMPGVQLRLDGSQGSVQNLERVASGQDTFAIATADAVAGFEGPGKDQLRAIARLYDDYLQLVVPANSPIHRTADLRGRRVGVGQPLSGVNLVARELLTAAGIDPDTGIQPAPVEVGDAASEMENHQLDAFFWSGGLPTAALSTLSEHLAFRIVPLDDLTDKLHAESADSAAYRPALLPAGVYPKSQAVPTLAVPNLLITRADVDPRLVEGLTRAVLDSRDQIGQIVHSAQSVDLRTAVYTDPLPLHAGAAQYYRSVKP